MSIVTCEKAQQNMETYGKSEAREISLSELIHTAKPFSEPVKWKLHVSTRQGCSKAQISWWRR